MASQHTVLMQMNSGFSCDRGRDQTIDLWMSSQVLFDGSTLHPPPPRMTRQFHFGSDKERDIAVHGHEGIASCSSVLWFGGGGGGMGVIKIVKPTFVLMFSSNCGCRSPVKYSSLQLNTVQCKEAHDKSLHDGVCGPGKALRRPGQTQTIPPQGLVFVFVF